MWKIISCDSLPRPKGPLNAFLHLFFFFFVFHPTITPRMTPETDPGLGPLPNQDAWEHTEIARESHGPDSVPRLLRVLCAWCNKGVPTFTFSKRRISYPFKWQIRRFGDPNKYTPLLHAYGHLPALRPDKWRTGLGSQRERAIKAYLQFPPLLPLS